MEKFLNFLTGEPPGDPRAEERWRRRARGQQRALEVRQQTEREEEAKAASYKSDETELAKRIYDQRLQRTGKSMPWSRKKDTKGGRSNTKGDLPPPLPKDSKEAQHPLSAPSVIETQREQLHNASPSRSNRGSPKEDLRPPTDVSAPPMDSVMARPHPRYNSRMQGEHTEPQRPVLNNDGPPQIIAELPGQELRKNPSWPAITSKQHDSDVSRPPRSRYSDYDEHQPPPRRSSLPPPKRRPVGAEYIGRERRSRARNHENARQEVSFQAANNIDLDPTLFRSDTRGSDPNRAKRDEERPNDPLTIMCKEYHGLKAEHSSFAFEGPFTLAQVTVASQCVINAYKTLSLKVQDFESSITLNDRDYKSLQSSYTKLKEKLESEMIWRDEQITQLRTESATRQGRVDQLNEDCEKRDKQMNDLRKEHQAETRNLIEKYNAQIQTLQKLKDQHEGEIKKTKEVLAEEMAQTLNGYRDENNKLKSDFERDLQTEKENGEKSIGKANEDWGKKLQEKQKELEDLEEIHKAKLKKADEDWGKLVQEKETELDQIDEVHDEKMRKANEEWEKRLQNKQTELDGINAVHEEAKRKLNEEWEKRLQNTQTELDGINAVHEEAKRKSNEEWERRLRGKQTELDGVRTDHIDVLRTVNQDWEKRLQDKQNELKSVISSCKDRIGKLKDSHEVMLANHSPGLRATNEQLKNALVERDHFKVISDREVANVFQDISSYIEEFAGEPWDSALQDTWPFPSVAFEELENDRRTRTHLMQNTLWVILYEMIFCTPFRVFGEEGVKLDMQWLEKFSQGGKFRGKFSPRPSREAEQWRYENMLTCVKATSQPLSNWEHNSRNFNIRQGYESTLQTTVNEMCQELENVTMVSHNDKQRINRFVKKAAELWLEIGQQRYRMFVVMSESGREPKRSARAALDRNRTLGMVVEPGLRRFGSAKGEQLEKESVVVDCAGKFSTFHCAA